MEWIRGPTIGRGSTAAVSLAYNADSSSRLFAVKSVELRRSLPLQRERSLLSKLSSPHVVSYLGFDITGENNSLLYNLWMEYVPGGTLRDLIHRRGGSLDEATARSLAAPVMEGLRYLHRNGIVHCDVKSQNVLIGEDGSPKIADFGCAKVVGSPEFSGTPMFMAPEVAQGEQQGFEADVWAFGCMVMEMLTGAAPWGGWAEPADPLSLLYRIGFSGDVPEIPAWLSEDAKDFLGKCLKSDPRKRWTAEQLLAHPFLIGSGHRVKPAGADGDSPVGVLDRAFWDSTEGAASEADLEPRPSSGMSAESDPQSSYAGARIGQLARTGVSSIQIAPDWSHDLDWLAVRGNGHETAEHIIILNSAVTDRTSISADNVNPPSLEEESSDVLADLSMNITSVSDSNEGVMNNDCGLMDLDFETHNVSCFCSWHTMTSIESP
ncbi:hypothetical protein SAY87_012667 [Trapa incisa]|uniref:Protein kinase domain-containing protein n=1 Tax=Trapa incisa TaxID=236973 RepID=A0AAN7GQS6_9MYRT|nr:hypothetical protein SAY87_012667 [Trapa incisa]